MKKQILLIAFLSSLIGMNLHAFDWQKYVSGSSQETEEKSEEKSEGKSDGKTFYGPTLLSDKKFQELNIYGPAKVSNLTVKGEAHFYGPARATESTFGQVFVKGPFSGTSVKMESLHVNGACELIHSIVKGEININGIMKALSSQLQNVSISGKLSLVDSTANQILIRKEEKGEEQYVYLDGKTKVEEIKFEGGNGIVVIKSPNATVNNIIGGKKRTDY